MTIPIIALPLFVDASTLIILHWSIQGTPIWSNQTASWILFEGLRGQSSFIFLCYASDLCNYIYHDAFSKTVTFPTFQMHQTNTAASSNKTLFYPNACIKQLHQSMIECPTCCISFVLKPAIFKVLLVMWQWIIRWMSYSTSIPHRAHLPSSHFFFLINFLCIWAAFVGITLDNNLRRVSFRPNWTFRDHTFSSCQCWSRGLQFISFVLSPNKILYTEKTVNLPYLEQYKTIHIYHLSHLNPKGTLLIIVTSCWSYTWFKRGTFHRLGFLERKSATRRLDAVI